MRHRIYKTDTGEVVIDTPASKYQGGLFEQCPHPWRFRESNPNKEGFIVDIITTEALHAMTGGNNEAGSAQFYYGADGKLKHDHEWNELIMPETCILKRHRASLEAELEEELAKEVPDPVAVIRKDRELKKLKDLSKDEVLNLALGKLEAQGKKPEIQAKLRAKLGKV